MIITIVILHVISYGLTGFTGLLLRKDFMESICMLMKISGMVSL